MEMGRGRCDVTEERLQNTTARVEAQRLGPQKESPECHVLAKVGRKTLLQRG